MATGPLICLIGVLLLILVAGTWVIRLHKGPVDMPVAVALRAGQNHHTVGHYEYVLSDYLDQEKQFRDKRQTEEHAQRIERLRQHEQLTQHQAELAAEQARDQAAWEAHEEAIAEWQAQQQQTDATLNPPPPPPPPPVDFKDANLSPRQRRQAIFQNLTAAPAAVAA